MKWSDRLDAVFGIDVRSLALLRVGLAVAVLSDLAARAPDLVAHYTAEGVLGREAAAVALGRGALLSVHFLLRESPLAVGALFGVAAVAAIALALGWRTRIATAVTWYLLVSLQVANPFVAHMGGDKFLRLLLFWSLFLPLGATASLDAARAARGGRGLVGRARVLSIPSAALLIQVATMYFVTGLRKNGGLWLDGTAVHYALHMDTVATPFTAWIRDVAFFVPLATYGTRAFEILGPLVPFVPWRTAWLRLAIVPTFVLFHLSLALFLNIGFFPLFSIVAWAAFVPAVFWDEVLPRLAGRRAPDVEADAGDEGDASVQRLPTPRWAQAAAGLALVYVASYVGTDLAGARLPSTVTRVGAALRLNQSWSMFAPNPPTESWWVVFEGHLADGGTVDPFRRAPVSWEKPASVPSTLRDFRWRSYIPNAIGGPPTDREGRLLHASFGRYLCREWNADHPGPERMESFRMVGMFQVIGASGMGEVRRQTVDTYRCDPRAPRRAGH